MTRLAASLIALQLCLAGAAVAAEKGKAAPAPKAAPAKPAPAAGADSSGGARAGGDDELGKGAKAIEFDENGNPKNADVEKAPEAEAKKPSKKEEPLKKGEISLAESCKLRMTALAGTMKRCLAGTGMTELLAFDDVIAGCAQMQGKAPYPRKDAEACAKGIASLKCDAKNADPMNPALLNPAGQVPACKPVLAAEQGAEPQTDKGSTGDFGSKKDRGFGSGDKGFGSQGDFGKEIDVNGGNDSPGMGDSSGNE